MRGPGEMLGEARRHIAIAETLYPHQMLGVQRPHRADRQPNAMYRQCVALAQRTELRVRRAAGAHVVFRMDLKEADRLRRGEDVGEMLRLEADAGGYREAGSGGYLHVRAPRVTLTKRCVRRRRASRSDHDLQFTT